MRLNKVNCAVMLATTLVAGNVSAASMADQIKARAAEMNELKTLLASPDAATRIAAIDVMQKSSDLAMRELAYAAGINADDEAVVALTIRNKFNEIDSFSIRFELPENATEEYKKAHTDYAGQILVKVNKYDPVKATFNSSSNHSSGSRTSTITGSTLHIATNYCSGKLALNDELLFTGTLSCEKFQFPATLQLF